MTVLATNAIDNVGTIFCISINFYLGVEPVYAWVGIFCKVIEKLRLEPEELALIKAFLV
jgi:hypothetical protein